MYRDLLRTLRQIPDPGFLRILVLSLVGAAVLFVGLVAVVSWALVTFPIFDTQWIDTLLGLLGTIAAIWIAILLFPAIAIAIQGLFLDAVAAAVERRYYPDLPEPRPQSWLEVALTTARLMVTVLAINLVALPFYLILTFVPPLNLVLFYLVNGYLLGREYFETVAVRRLPPPEARLLRRQAQGRIWLAGAVIAFLFSIPLVNLTAPTLGTALMLHLFQRLGTDPGVPPESGRLSAKMHAGMITLALVSAAAVAALLPGLTKAPGVTARAALHTAIVPPDPRELIGLGQINLWNRLGAPHLVRREPGVRVWQYAADTCVLDLYLYEQDFDFRVAHVSARARREGRQVDPQCYATIIGAEKTVPEAPARAVQASP